MRRARLRSLAIGPAVVQRLLPQRPPFLMLDTIESLAFAEVLRIRAARYLSITDPVFQGHFPKLPVYPGALLIEGVGQAASLAYTLDAVGAAYEKEGSSRSALLDDLEALSRRLSLQPSVDGESSVLEDAFERLDGHPVGVAGAVRFKFLKPITPGCKLVYDVQLTQRADPLLHFEAEILRDDVLVARGTLSAALVAPGSL